MGLKEIMGDWIEYNFTEHKSEEEYLVAKEKMIKIQEEKQVSLKEWDTIWMMFKAKKIEEDENKIREDSQKNVIGDKTLQADKSIYFMNHEILNLKIPMKLVPKGFKETDGDCRKRMNVRILKDNKPTLKSIDQWVSKKEIWPDDHRKYLIPMELEQTSKRIDQWVSEKEIWPDDHRKCLTLEIKKLGGQVIVKGQENPLTGDKKRTKNFNVRHKSVVEFEPDLKLKKLKESTTTGRITKQKNRLKPEATDATTTNTTTTTTTTTTTITITTILYPC